MKKYFSIFAIYSICLCTLTFYVANMLHKDKKSITDKYLFVGNDSIDEGFENVRSLYSNGEDPFGVYNKPDGIICDTKSAVNIAEEVLFSLYGEDAIKKQRPYSVRMMNHHIWCIEGNLKKGFEGGVFCILIDKRDCRVISISHGK